MSNTRRAKSSSPVAAVPEPEQASGPQYQTTSPQDRIQAQANRLRELELAHITQTNLREEQEAIGGDTAQIDAVIAEIEARIRFVSGRLAEQGVTFAPAPAEGNAE